MAENVKLGQLIDPKDADAQRDATHVGAAPVYAGAQLSPGQRVSVRLELGRLVAGHDGTSGIGIVDPFLREPVRVGQRFWLLLDPGTTTAVRHAWTHPVFDAIDAAIAEVTKAEEDEDDDSGGDDDDWCARSC